MTKRSYDASAVLGMAIVKQKVVGNLKWIFREQYESDYGIDAHMEVVNSSGIPTGKVIALQVKAGPSYFKESTHVGFVYRPSSAHVSYWQDHSLPVLIVLVDLKTKRCFWQLVDSSTVVRTPKACKMIIPRHQTLSSSSKGALREIVSQHRYSPALVRLSLAKPLMRAASSGKLWLEGERWINKLSGRSALKFLLGTGDKAKVILEWPYIFSPGISFGEMICEDFPWAKFSVDEVLYEQCEEQMWEEETSIYMEGEVIDHSDTFEQWKELRERRGLREYEVEAGQVARYRFRVRLSNLGKAYLIIDRHIEAQ